MPHIGNDTKFNSLLTFTECYLRSSLVKPVEAGSRHQRRFKRSMQKPPDPLVHRHYHSSLPIPLQCPFTAAISLPFGVGPSAAHLHPPDYRVAALLPLLYLGLLPSFASASCYSPRIRPLLPVADSHGYRCTHQSPNLPALNLPGLRPAPAAFLLEPQTERAKENKAPSPNLSGTPFPSPSIQHR